MNNEIIKNIIDTIQKYQTIIIHRHLRPDGDCIGTSLGLREVLRNSFPDKKVYSVGGNIPDFLKFIGKNVLVGHNVQFDISFVEKAAKDLNYEFSNDSLDTLALSKETFPDFKSYKLVDLSKKFSISHLDAHRALSDVFATADLFRIITKEQSK